MSKKGLPLCSVVTFAFKNTSVVFPAVSSLNDKGSAETLLPAPEGPQVDPVARSVMVMLAQNLEDLAVELRESTGQPIKDQSNSSLPVRVQDQVSYIVSVGVVDKLSAYFHGVQDPIDSR